eukprot:1157707-Pelagomonas_calceolata.AAC.7
MRGVFPLASGASTEQPPRWTCSSKKTRGSKHNEQQQWRTQKGSLMHTFFNSGNLLRRRHGTSSYENKSLQCKIPNEKHWSKDSGLVITAEHDSVVLRDKTIKLQSLPFDGQQELLPDPRSTAIATTCEPRALSPTHFSMRDLILGPGGLSPPTH